MRALKALLRDLVLSQKSLPELVEEVMHNVMAPDSSPAFDKETINHVCDLVLEASSGRPSPESFEGMASLATFLQELGHFAEDPCSRVVETSADEDRLLVDRAIEVVALLSFRWFAMKHHVSMPEMSDYQRQKWLPPAFSYLVGQILWRQRTAGPLQSRDPSVVENMRWVTAAPGVGENMVDQCNAVFRILSGSNTGHMKVSQWRKVMELIATNPELRPRARRCDAVRACYGDAHVHSEIGLSRKNFKLMLIKTADLMAVHPVVLFKELASHADSLEASQKSQKESRKDALFLK